MFNKNKKKIEDEPGHDLIKTQSNTVTRHTVSDPVSRVNHEIYGEILTGPGDEHEIQNDMRVFVAATSGKQVFFAKSEENNPKVQSLVKSLKMKLGNDVKVHAVEGSTIAEIYRIAGHHEQKEVKRKSTDTSRMQRELLGIVGNASRINASDIHIIVNQDKAFIKFRVDGVMRDAGETQPSHAHEMLSSAYALADESESNYQLKSYQAARISSLKTNLPEGVQSLRLQFNPLANNGRYLIMRLLYSGDGKTTELSELGYNQKQIDQIKTMSARPVGINVISGPTGSGKSTTLKAILEGMLDRRGGEINTITIEDPPEYIIKNAQQMPVTNAKTQEERSAAFTAAISAGLRSDPDIIMIGEIRDRASADLAVEGALSGHPIYASLHANTAMDILSRLRDMGIEDFKVFDHTIFSGLLGQRLLRKLCPECRIPYKKVLEQGLIDPLFDERLNKMLDVTPDHLKQNTLYVANPEGCHNCSKGYTGRSVVSEIILPDEKFMEFMKDNKKSEARDYWFTKLNGIDLLGASWLRALQGQISPLDIENTVALLSPSQAHHKALEYWGNIETETKP